MTSATNNTKSVLILPVEGMSCASCVGRVEKIILKQPNVLNAHANLANATVHLDVNGPIDAKQLAQALQKGGYPVVRHTQVLDIDGMSCASCVGRVEKLLNAIPFVEQVQVNLATQQATFTAPINQDLNLIYSKLNKGGYQARLHEAQAQGPTPAERDVQRFYPRMIWALVLAVPVFIMEMGSHLIPGFHALVQAVLPTPYNIYLQFLLTTAVLIGPGRYFYTQGLPALWRGAPDMNSLVAVGSLAAYLYSLVATFTPQLLPEGSVHVYYEAAAVIVALVLVGRYMEARAKGRTSAAIQNLLGLQPKHANVWRDGQFVALDLAQIQVGDKVQLRPGERVAMDGVVTEGNSYVDESMISGEPVPVAKQIGSKLVGGTVNQQGGLVYEVHAVGGDTVLAHIIQMVEQAQASKLPVQALVDRVTLWFVPAVMLIAVLTGLAWWYFYPDAGLSMALSNAVAVLIIACPCAMGLATPTSIMVSTGRAAQMGILFRQGDALQSLRDVKVVAVDKTGTLTKGKPELTDLIVSEGYEREQLLAWVAAIELRSEHPIAQAIVEAAKKQALQLPALESFQSLTGLGVEAIIHGRHVWVGADRLMSSRNINMDSLALAAEKLAKEGKTPLYVAVDQKLAALIAVADPIKESSREAIKALHKRDIPVIMLTGDNRHTADAVSQQLGIFQTIAELMPSDKVEAIKRLQKQYGKIAFVGDGINDAPALAHADVGIAIGTGTDIAVESADVVLMSDDLKAVVSAIDLSIYCLRNIKQNLFWAFFYNIALIPIAAGLLYIFKGPLLSPMLAAAAMTFSSTFVLVNALRLRVVKLNH